MLKYSKSRCYQKKKNNIFFSFLIIFALATVPTQTQGNVIITKGLSRFLFLAGWLGSRPTFHTSHLVLDLSQISEICNISSPVLFYPSSSVYSSAFKYFFPLASVPLSFNNMTCMMICYL